ncbi:MAG TPA: dUTP diphosphatase [Myxococcota bacterium]|nr:dUTP diphosphatase [Myxococcota bacterium]
MGEPNEAVLGVAVRVLPNGEGLALPAYQTAGSAGCDLRAAVVAEVVLAPRAWAVVPCGFAMALPEGWEAQVRPRSGLAARHGVTVLNAPGTIDADYRGEIQVPLINHGHEPFVVRRGDRIAQLVLGRVTQAAWVHVDELPETARGERGFGSTGR